MFSTSPLIAANLAFLQQGVDLLEQIGDELFAAPPPLSMSPVGGHLRHCLDFYGCFLEGCASGEVDYDGRCRDPRIETEREHALEVMRQVMTGLTALEGADEERALRVANDRAPGEEGEAAWSRSSVRRELQFLRSHTVHHFALIAAVLSLQGFAVPEGFGVAPSTLTYRARSEPAPESPIREEVTTNA